MDRYWIIEGEKDNIIATAIHAGHKIRKDILKKLAIKEEDRLREEDPFTDIFASAAKYRVIATHSRFEIDFNRPRDKAVYLSPEDAWGLDLYKEPLTKEDIEKSLKIYDCFYEDIKKMFDEIKKEYKNFVVLDIHSFNHHRKGPNAPFDDPKYNPDINIGTKTNPYIDRWRSLIDKSIEFMRDFDYFGKKLDVRENVKFGGGYFAKWIHENYAPNACVLSLEFKKIFMDEWSGKADFKQIDKIKEMIFLLIPILKKELERINNE